MQLAPHGRLTRGGFSGSDGLLLPPVVNERRVRERVGQRRAVFDRDGVAVALDHLRALPAAWPLQGEQIRAGALHPVRRPGVAQEVRVEAPQPGLLSDPGEELAEAVDGEELSLVGRKERIGVAHVMAGSLAALHPTSPPAAAKAPTRAPVPSALPPHRPPASSHTAVARPARAPLPCGPTPS